MVEHTAVNRGVVGSSPTRGVFFIIRRQMLTDFLYYKAQRFSEAVRAEENTDNITIVDANTQWQYRDDSPSQEVFFMTML